MPSRINRLMKDEIIKRYKDARNMILVGYRGLDSLKTASFRSELFKENIHIHVVKNRITILAFDEIGKPDLKGLFTGPTAIMDGDDPVTMAKLAVNFLKREKTLEIKGGWVEGKMIEAADVERLARMPSKKQLQALVTFAVASPLSGLARAVAGPLQAIVNVLSEAAKKAEKPETKPETEPAAAAS